MIQATSDLAGVLSARNRPMDAVMTSPWLDFLASVPEDAAIPLAMSARHPRAVGSYGPECIAWAKKELKITFRWWQALAICRQLEYDADGALVWREVIDSGPRRIGKSVRLRAVALWRMGMTARIGEPQLIMLVSKDLAVGKEIHRPSWLWAERRGWSVTRLGGAQEVDSGYESGSGGRWLLRADSAVYGYDVGYGQVDESWGVDPQAISDGLEPALLERMWPQLHLTSTAHVKATSLMRRRLVAALRDSDPNVLLMLWGAGPDDDLDDPRTWRAASPHWSAQRSDLVQRKWAAAKAGQAEPEFDDPDPVRGWASQYLNVWPRLMESGTSILPGWKGLASALKMGDPVALGVASDPDGVWLSLGAADNGERPHVGSVFRVRAEQEAAFIQEVKRIQHAHNGIPVIVDAKGPASDLIRTMENAGIAVTRIGLDDYVQACADMEKAVRGARISHGDYGELNDAVHAAGWRKVGDRRVFGRNGGDISMLEAVTLALWSKGTPEPASRQPMASFI